MTGTTHVLELFNLTSGAGIAEVLTASISCDTGWAPRWNATVTVPDVPALTARYYGLRWTRHEGRALPLSGWTALLGGTPLSAWTGLGLASPRAITAATDGDPTAGPSETLTLGLQTSRKPRSRRDGTATLTLTSCEMELQKVIYKGDQSGPSWMRPLSVQGAVRTVLDLVGDGGKLIEQPAASIPLLTPLELEIGMSAWDALDPLLDAADLALYADTRTEYRLVPRERAAPVLPHLILTDDDLTDDEPVDDYDAGFRTLTIIRRVDPKTDGTETRLIGSHSGSYFERGVYREYPSKLPAGDRFGTEPDIGFVNGDPAYVRDFTTPARPSLRPYHLVRINEPDREPFDGLVQSITWQYPDGLMRVSTLAPTPFK